MAEADTNSTAPAPPAAEQPPQGPPPWWQGPPAVRKSRAKKIIIYFCVLTLILSLAINFYLVAILAALSDSAMSESVLQDGAEDQVVAVYEFNGLITSKTAADFERFFRLLRDRKDIKAVVVRVDSPGGYVGPSDVISRMIRLIGEKYERPVVVSMGGVAASGGYYISAPADEIFAEPTTITASIGVVMQFPVVHDWLEEHGLKVITIRSSQSQRHKAALNTFENPTPDMLRRQQKLLDAIHDKFVQVVKAGRGGKIKEELISVKVKDFDGKEITREQTFPFDGQVLTAKAAEDVGLVDRIGYLDDAVRAAVKLARLDDPRVVRFAKTRGLLSRMLSSADVEIPTGLDTKLLERYLSPRPMMIWEGQ